MPSIGWLPPLSVSPRGPPCTFSLRCSGNYTHISLLLLALPASVPDKKCTSSWVSLSFSWNGVKQIARQHREYMSFPLRRIPLPGCLPWAEVALRAAAIMARPQSKVTEGKDRDMKIPSKTSRNHSGSNFTFAR